MLRLDLRSAGIGEVEGTGPLRKPNCLRPRRTAPAGTCHLREPPEWPVHRAFSPPIALAHSAARVRQGPGGKRRRQAASPLRVRRTQCSQRPHIFVQHEAASRPQGHRVCLLTLRWRRQLCKGWRTPMITPMPTPTFAYQTPSAAAWAQTSAGRNRSKPAGASQIEDY
jgi:hypothetical protein